MARRIDDDEDDDVVGQLPPQDVVQDAYAPVEADLMWVTDPPSDVEEDEIEDLRAQLARRKSKYYSGGYPDDVDQRTHVNFKQGPKHAGMGDDVGGNVPLAKLLSVGSFILESTTIGDRMCKYPLWPIDGQSERVPAFLEPFRRMFSSKTEFEKMIFGERGWPRRHTPQALTNPDYDTHLRELLASKVVGYSKDVGTPWLWGRYRAVAKDVVDGEIKTARAIFAVYDLNNLGNPPPSFPLFSIQGFLQKLQAINKKLYFVSADLRNFYYQLKIPDWMSPLMCVRVGNEVYMAEVLPMGWTWSCIIAQALTVAILGRLKTGKVSLGFPHAELRDLEAPPGCFDIVVEENGVKKVRGVCAVIYDTVLIAVDSEDFANDWQKRINDNFNDAGLELKYCKVETTTIFSGMELSCPDGRFAWRVAPSTFRNWQIVAPYLLPTPRALWKGVGLLLRYSEVHVVPRVFLAQVAKAQVALTVSRENLRGAEWDAPTVDLGHIQLLSRLIARLNNACSSINTIRGFKRGQGIWTFYATDATPTRSYACEFDSNGQILWQDVIEHDEPKAIQEAEAIAMNMAARRPVCAEARRSNSREIRLIAGDNIPVNRGFFKGYSKANDIDKHLVSYDPWVAVVIVDVPTGVNVADVGSRKGTPGNVDAEFDFRMRQTRDRLNAVAISFEKWPRFYFARTDECFARMPTA
jgi:hypothetical protein